MSEHDAYDALIDKVDRLEADLEEHRGTLAVLIEEQNRTTTAIEDMASAVETLDPSTSATADGETPAKAWAETATGEDWADLADWVDAFITRYEFVGWLRPCWPRHGGVVEELAALRLAWRTATAAIRAVVEEEDGDELAAWTDAGDEAELVWSDQETYAYWHDRILEPTVRRLGGSFYQMSSCRNGHQDPAAVQLTDRTAIPTTRRAGAPAAALEETS